MVGIFEAGGRLRRRLAGHESERGLEHIATIPMHADAIKAWRAARSSSSASAPAATQPSTASRTSLARAVPGAHPR
jgi:hypothetical protein